MTPRRYSAVREQTRELAVVLPRAAVNSGEPYHFAGFPGVFVPDVPISAAALAAEAGVTDLQALAVSLSLPLEFVKVDLGSAPLPDRPNHGESATDSAPPPVAVEIDAEVEHEFDHEPAEVKDDG